MVLLLFALFRAGFEPLSCRCDHGPSLRIEGRPVSLGAVSRPMPRLKTGADWLAKEPNLGRAEFFALPFRVPAPVRRFADSPYRPQLLTNHFSPLTFSASVSAHATSAFASNFYGGNRDGWAVEVPDRNETGRGR
jgi:hypothetical protein